MQTKNSLILNKKSKYSLAYPPIYQKSKVFFFSQKKSKEL